MDTGWCTEEARRRRARCRRALVVQPAAARRSRRSRVGRGAGPRPAPKLRTRRRSAAARCSRRTTRGTRTCRSCRCAPTPRTLINTISTTGGQTMLHPDFGGGGAYGIPFIVVPAEAEDASRSTTPRTATRADPGPFPIPPNAPVEGGSSSDRRSPRARRAEAARVISTSSTTRSGAATTGTRLRRELEPRRRTSCARSAGPRPTRPACPIFPGLVRYGEVHDRRDPPRAALHGGGDADAATSSRRRTTRRRRPTRRCRRWDCGCGLKAELLARPLPRAVAGDPARR